MKNILLLTMMLFSVGAQAGKYLRTQKEIQRLSEEQASLCHSQRIKKGALGYAIKRYQETGKASFLHNTLSFKSQINAIESALKNMGPQLSLLQKKATVLLWKEFPKFSRYAPAHQKKSLVSVLNTFLLAPENASLATFVQDDDLLIAMESVPTKNHMEENFSSSLEKSVKKELPKHQRKVFEHEKKCLGYLSDLSLQSEEKEDAMDALIETVNKTLTLQKGADMRFLGTGKRPHPKEMHDISQEEAEPLITKHALFE